VDRVNSFSVLAAREGVDEASTARRTLVDRREENRTIGLDYPNICNAGSTLASLYRHSTAWRQRPAGATLGTAII
jgi:hypothetical protein